MEGDIEYEPMISMELQTGGSAFVCPYAHCAHRHKSENLRLTYTVNGRESGTHTGCCKLTRKCTRADNFTVPVYDQPAARPPAARQACPHGTPASAP
jgi:hypothetical protein